MLNEMFKLTSGKVTQSWRLIDKIEDETRGLYIFKDGDRLAFGFLETIGPIMSFSMKGFMSKDWRKNFRFWKKSYSVGSKTIKAHAGFVEEYLTLRTYILGAIEVHKPKEIIVSGFSQGSAHATLAFRDIVHYFGGPVHGYAFGSPRVYSIRGAIEFGKKLKKSGCTFTRITMHGDPVTHLAPWVFNYCHVGKEVTLYGHGFPHSENEYDYVTKVTDESAD